MNILYGPHCWTLRNRPISDNSSYVNPISSLIGRGERREEERQRKKSGRERERKRGRERERERERERGREGGREGERKKEEREKGREREKEREKERGIRENGMEEISKVLHVCMRFCVVLV